MNLAVARVTILSCLLRLGAGGLHHHDILFEPSNPPDDQGGPAPSAAGLTGGPGHSAAGLTGSPAPSAAGLTGGLGHSAADLTGGPGHSAADLTGGSGHSAADLTGGSGHSAAGLGTGLSNPAAQADSGLRHPVILVPGDGGSQVRNGSMHRVGRVLSVLQSLELGLPHPFSRRRVCPPSLWSGGEGTLACG
jgi:hypothetical protein